MTESSANVSQAPTKVTALAVRWQRWTTNHQRLLLGAAGLTTVLSLWELGARMGVLNPVLFSSPAEIIRSAQSDVFRNRIVEDLTTSLSELVVGVAIATVLGFLIGFVIGWFRHANYVLDPWVTVLYSTPKVALVPLIILLLGIDFWTKVTIVALLSIFSVIVNTMVGVQAARGPLLDVARSFGASEMRQWLTVVLPASVPFVVTGVRLALGHGMIGVIVAELVAGTHGLGSLLRYAAFSLQTGIVFLAIILIGTWGMIAGEVMRRVEQRAERWRPA